MGEFDGEIPETGTLLSLKRPALQKLCKKAGLKANGKNTAMITSLELFRESSMSDVKPEVEGDRPTAVAPKVEPSTEEEEMVVPKIESSPVVVGPKKEGFCGQDPKEPSPEEWSTPKEPSPEEQWSTPPTSPQPVPAKKANRGGRKKGGKRRGKKSALQPTPSPSPLPATPIEDVKPEPQPASLNAQATPPSERLSRKRKRRDTYSLSPSETSLCAPHSTKQLKLDPGMPAQRERDCTNLAEGATPPFTPPSSADRQPASNRRRRHSTFVVSSNNSSVTGAESSELASCNTPATELSVKPGSKRKRNHTYNKDGGSPTVGDDVASPPGSQDDQPLTKRSRRSTYEIPSHESSLVNSPVVSSRLNESGLAVGDVGVASESSGCNEDEDQDVKGNLLSLLEKRVEERKADPNYKPVFAASTSASRIPVKSATAKKFEKAHQKQFNKMQSITSCYQTQLARTGERRRCTNISASSKKPKRQSLTSLARASMRRSLSAKKPTTVAASGKASTKFRPSVTTTKGAKFNFTTTTTVTTVEKTVSFGPSALRPQNCSKVESRTSQRPKTPGKIKPTSSSSVKTPSKFPGGENKTHPSKKFDLQASLKRPKPKYKAYTGKLSTAVAAKH